MTKGKRRTFTKEFKEQIVQLYMSGKARGDIIKRVRADAIYFLKLSSPTQGFRVV